MIAAMYTTYAYTTNIETMGRERTDMQIAVNQVPAIHVQGLEKSYKKLAVLRGVDFDVMRGSIFALLGSNGAGKTTVVKILSTLLKADAGTARVNGFDVARQAADVRESISLTGQFAAVEQGDVRHALCGAGVQEHL